MADKDKSKTEDTKTPLRTSEDKSDPKITPEPVVPKGSPIEPRVVITPPVIPPQAAVVVDPSVPPGTAHRGILANRAPNDGVILAISGKDITIISAKEMGYEDPPKFICKIAKMAEVYLNGEKTTLAALDNGDRIKVGNGGRNHDTYEFEYKRVDAYRCV